MQKTIVVTGGAGFIGSHLIEALVKDPSNWVISLDNYFTGSKDNHIEGAEYRDGHTKDIEKHITETPDLIYHLGEYARVEQSFHDIDTVWDLNVNGTLGVLEYWRKKSCKLVYAGSSTKFGDGGLGRVGSPYAWSKAANTELVQNYGRWFELPYAITYFYNVYGPRERSGTYGTVVEIFRQKHQEGKPLTVEEPGTQRRNFTHVADVVSALLLIGERGEGDDFGIGSASSFSILELAKMFSDNVTMVASGKGNRMDSFIDTSKTEVLGWKSEKKLKDYIEEVK